eukprot:967542_1
MKPPQGHREAELIGQNSGQNMNNSLRNKNINRKVLMKVLLVVTVSFGLCSNYIQEEEKQQKVLYQCSFASLFVLCTVLYRMKWTLFVMMFAIFALDSVIVLNNESAIKVSQCLISSPFVWTVVCQLIPSGI